MPIRLSWIVLPRFVDWGSLANGFGVSVNVDFITVIFVVERRVTGLGYDRCGIRGCSYGLRE